MKSDELTPQTRFSYVHAPEVGTNPHASHSTCRKIGSTTLNLSHGGGSISRFEGPAVDILYFSALHSNGPNKEYIGMAAGTYLYCII